MNFTFNWDTLNGKATRPEVKISLIYLSRSTALFSASKLKKKNKQTNKSENNNGQKTLKLPYPSPPLLRLHLGISVLPDPNRVTNKRT